MVYKAVGKKAIFGEVAKNYSIRLYSWEVAKVKDYIKLLRKLKKDGSILE